MLSDVEVARLRKAVGAKPKPVWQEFYCARCDRPFKAQSLMDVCPPCNVPALKAGLRPLAAGVSGC